MRKLILNSIQCKFCKDIITSYSVHDFVTYKCGKVSTDGGLEYQHLSFPEHYKTSIKNLARYSDEPFDKIREIFTWGSYGKSGKEELKYIPLCKLTDTHLLAILATQKRISEFTKELLLKEQKYRINNKITIKE